MEEIKEKPNQQQSFQERCLMLGIRMTSQRRLLASVLNESNDHPDVDTIYQRCKAKDKSTSIASIYRSLSLFEDSGLIEKLDMGDGKARFEIKRTDHDHLLDVETGQIHEFKSQELQRLIKEIADEMGFDLTEHRLEIYGRPKDEHRVAELARSYTLEAIDTRVELMRDGSVFAERQLRRC